jgi:hypothetical protein
MEIKKFEKDTSELIATTLQNLAEGLTGIAASDRQELGLSIGQMFQRLRGGKFLSVLLDTWNKFREKGRIKDDYQFSEQHKVCLSEMLDFLENDCPDEMRFTILKKIFLIASTETISNRNDLIPQQYMEIARSLNDGEILILNTAYKIVKSGDWDPKDIANAASWLKRVSEESELQYPELVELHEESLVKKHLLTGRLRSDRSGIIIKPHFRLTEFGYRFCEYIDNYED